MKKFKIVLMGAALLFGANMAKAAYLESKEVASQRSSISSLSLPTSSVMAPAEVLS